MQGDFTRSTFNREKNYHRVLMQQGRVQLDADWNEATEIQLYLLRTLAADLIWPHGGPSTGPASEGFKIVGAQKSDGSKVPRDFQISKGHYYVDGILCESNGLQFTAQPGFDKDIFGDLGGDIAKTCLVYLDVWERHITYIEDEIENWRSIREVALRGLDTATRAQVVCQVRCLPIETGHPDFKKNYDLFIARLNENKQTAFGGGQLRARARKTPDADTLCTTAPEARYRGAENQLYRVEIHDDGALGTATFKWSRENGSVVFPIRSASADNIMLKGLRRDDRLGLARDAWVEILDDDSVLRNRPQLLRQIEEINTEEMSVLLKKGGATSTVGQDVKKHPLLRRWDSPTQLVRIPPDNKGWLSLEDGVEIKFEADENTLFRSGDYWLIPARVATGDVEWPGPWDAPESLAPLGVEHHYAPLAIISLDNKGEILTDPDDLRRMWTLQTK